MMNQSSFCAINSYLNITQSIALPHTLYIYTLALASQRWVLLLLWLLDALCEGGPESWL